MESSHRQLRLRLNYLWACLLVVLVATLTYQGTLGNFFSASDTLTLIQSSRLQPGHSFADVFSEKMMDGTTFEGVFYRPISVLSFDLDYWIWHLNPFGYHLTNLLLHVLVALMTFLLGLQLTRGMLRTSLVAALLFSCHPVLVETVPAIARRQDILDALFLLLSFATYLRGRTVGGRAYPAVSVMFFVLALGAKETGIQIPGLIFVHALIFARTRNRGAGARLVEALKATMPYFLVTAVYLIWRIHVLGGIGVDGADLPPLWIAVHFFSCLLYPQDFLLLRDNLVWVPAVGTLIVALVGLGFLVVATGISRRRPEEMKLPLLLVAWLILPLFILTATGSFAYRSLYSTVIPFSLLLSLTLSRGRGLLVLRTWREAVAVKSSRLVLFVGALLLASSLVALSPLVRDYPLWRQSGLIASQILTAVSEQLEQLPPDAVISIDGLPRGPAASIVAPHPRAHSVSYLRDYSVQSWLDLQDGDKGIKVLAHNSQDLPPQPCSMDLKIERIAPARLDVKIVWVKSIP